MFSKFRFILFLAIALPCVFVSCDKDDDEPYDVMIDFQSTTFPGETKYNNNSGDAGLFKEGIVSFQNTQVVVDDYPLWYGFAYSQMHDLTTSDYTNEFSAYVLNDPQENKFMVGYISSWNAPSIEITFSQPVKDLSFDVANTTYAALSMKDGVNQTKKFTDTDADWFKLTMVATSSEGTETVTINLGEGTKITNVWNPIHFTLKNITKLDFSLTSTDNDPQYGMKTPAYFCIDNVKARIVK